MIVAYLSISANTGLKETFLIRGLFSSEVLFSINDNYSNQVSAKLVTANAIASRASLKTSCAA